MAKTSIQNAVPSNSYSEQLLYMTHDGDSSLASQSIVFNALEAIFRLYLHYFDWPNVNYMQNLRNRGRRSIRVRLIRSAVNIENY